MYNFYDEVSKMRTIELGVEKITAQRRINLSDVRASVIADQDPTILVQQLEARVVGRTIDRVVEYPADWKEAFKERWFPKWLLQKFPVKYEVYDVKVLYPSIHIPEHEAFATIHVRE